MLTLYYKESCPFCQRVLQMAENLKVELDLRDVASDESQLAELIEKQGHGEVPYMFDTEKEVAIDESSDIIEYMRENYSKGAIASPASMKPKIHVGGSVCESCEG